MVKPLVKASQFTTPWLALATEAETNNNKGARTQARGRMINQLTLTLVILISRA